MENKIVVSNLYAGYGAVKVLHDISIELNEGETVILLGTNGNGKSTLIKCLMGLVKPDQGEIIWHRGGERIDLSSKSTEEIVQMGISLVPEGRRLFAQLTVQENLLLGAYRAEARKDIDQNLRSCFETFPRLEERKKQLAGSMSGGEQQMLAVARALMSSPKILIVDEPSQGLAPIFVSLVIEKIKEMQQRFDLTVLMSEQNFNQATKIADRGYILVEGRIVFEGHNKALRNNEMVKKFYLGV